MSYRIMLLYNEGNNKENTELVRLMRNRVLHGTNDIIIPEAPLVRVCISEATLVKSEGRKPSILAKSGSRAGAILMYDTTRRRTFDELIDWIDAFRSYAAQAAVVLILANRSHELTGTKRVISKEEGKHLAKEAEALYCEAGTQVPHTVKEALLCVVRCIESKVKAGTLGSGPNQGIIPMVPKGPRRYSTSSLPNGQQAETLPKVTQIESKLSYVEEDLKRTKQLHEAEKDSLQEDKRQLSEENSSLWQRVENVTREMRELTTQNSELQKKCRSLKQQLFKQENDFVLENTKLQSNLESKAVEVERLSNENANLQKMCATPQQDSTVVKQENSQLKEMLKDLQYQLSLKEDAFKNEVRLHDESNAALRNVQLALNRALAENRSLQQQNPPQIADHWKVSRHEVILKGANLGHGAWGYVAEGKFRGKSVAVKCLHEEIMTHQTVERVHREIHTMASVRHPNFVLFIAAVLDEGPPMIITELLDTNLRMAYEKRWLKDANIKLEILHGVACALNYLHKLCEPIIHRDVSAPNVLLKAASNDRWTPKLSDFGSANLAQLSQTLGEGAIIYSAPEMYPQSLCSIVHTTKIDVYSYGVLLGEVFTEQLPNPDTLFYTLQHIEAHWPHIHGLMLRCIKRNPEERPDMDSVITEYLETFWHIE